MQLNRLFDLRINIACLAGSSKKIIAANEKRIGYTGSYYF